MRREGRAVWAVGRCRDVRWCRAQENDYSGHTGVQWVTPWGSLGHKRRWAELWPEMVVKPDWLGAEECPSILLCELGLSYWGQSDHSCNKRGHHAEEPR